MAIVFFIVSLLASVAGAICGIGGGVIIKPVLDMLGLASVSTISFLSSCTVLSMSCYSVVKALAAKDSLVEMRTGTPLALGAAAGGVVGNVLFGHVRSLFPDANSVGAVQAGCLAAITVGTLLYTLFKGKIKTRQVRSMPVCVGIGLVLGVMSSFLGIGGGPINLVVLYYFFSMPTKVAAQNSLYIILFSQITNLASTLLGGNVPAFQWPVLLLMVAGGILGGILGRLANKRLSDNAVSKLFICLMVVIIGISVYNVVQYTGL